MSRSKRVARASCVALLALTGAIASSGPASASKGGDSSDTTEAFKRDVYVVVGVSLRNPDETTPPDAELFNVAAVNLNMTWGQWQAASGTSTMTVHGHHTDDDLVLTGLVPNGVYSLFYGTLNPDTSNPLCPFVERTLPLTSTDKHQQPDSSSFVAGPDGTATYSARISGDPLTAGQVFIEVVYHNDGKTYGPLPNAGESLTQGEPQCHSSFGEDAMRQLVIWQKI